MSINLNGNKQPICAKCDSNKQYIVQHISMSDLNILTKGQNLRTVFVNTSEQLNGPSCEIENKVS